MLVANLDLLPYYKAYYFPFLTTHHNFFMPFLLTNQQICCVKSRKRIHTQYLGMQSTENSHINPLKIDEAIQGKQVRTLID